MGIKIEELEVCRVKVEPCDCGNPECTNGKVEFKCYNCGQGIYDASGYGDLQAIYEGGTSHFSCPKCKTHLVMNYNPPSQGFYVFKDIIMAMEPNEERKYKMKLLK